MSKGESNSGDKNAVWELLEIVGCMHQACGYCRITIQPANYPLYNKVIESLKMMSSGSSIMLSGAV